jgi:hypothetical protein
MRCFPRRCLNFCATGNRVPDRYAGCVMLSRRQAEAVALCGRWPWPMNVGVGTMPAETCAGKVLDRQGRAATETNQRVSKREAFRRRVVRGLLHDDGHPVDRLGTSLDHADLRIFVRFFGPTTEGVAHEVHVEPVLHRRARSGRGRPQSRARP